MFKLKMNSAYQGTNTTLTIENYHETKILDRLYEDLLKTIYLPNYIVFLVTNLKTFT